MQHVGGVEAQKSKLKNALENQKKGIKGMDQEIGVLRENISDEYFSQQGFKGGYPTKIKGGSNNGIDAMYEKDGKVYINEVKGIGKNGSISMGPTKDSRHQMTEEWIEEKIEAMINEGDKKGNKKMVEAAHKIQQAMKEGRLVKLVTGVDANGNLRVLRAN